MNRRAKVIATISTLCLAIVMLTVSVLAATSISFTIGGTVAYEVQDVLVNVNTNFYYSTDNTVLKGDAITTKANLVAGETLPTDLASVEGFTPKSVSTYKNGQVVELTDEEKTVSGLQVNFGKYDEQSQAKKSYSYYLVMEVTNLGEKTIAVNVVDNTTAENVEKLATTAINLVNNGVKLNKNETKKVVLAFNITDLTQSITTAEFSYAVTIGEALPDLIVNSTNASNENMTYTNNYAPIVTFEDVQAKVEKDEVNDMFGAIYNTTLSNIPENAMGLSITYDTNSYYIDGLYSHQESFIQANNLLGEIYNTDDDDYINSNIFWSPIDLSKQQNRTLNLCLVVYPNEEAEEIVFDFNFEFYYAPEIDESLEKIYLHSRDDQNNTVTYSKDYADVVTFADAEAKLEQVPNGPCGVIYNVSLYNIPDKVLDCSVGFEIENLDTPMGLYSNQNSFLEAFMLIEELFETDQSQLIPDGVVDLTKQENGTLHLCFLFILDVDPSQVSEVTIDLTFNFTIAPDPVESGVVVDEEVVDGPVIYTFDYETLSYSAKGNPSYGNKAISNLVIADSIESNGRSYPVTKIEFEAFYGRNYITSVTIPEGIKVIEGNAFSSCFDLAGELVIPNSVISIGDGAFANTKITSVHLGNNVNYIGSQSFRSCSELNSISIGENVECIMADAFSDSKYYRDDTNWQDYVLYLTARDNTTKYLIEAKSDLTGEYSLLENTRLIAESAFGFKCKELTSITLPDSLKYINSFAFSNCSQLATISVGSNLEIIGAGILSNTVVYNNYNSSSNKVLYLTARDNTTKYLISAEDSKLSSNEIYTVEDDTKIIAGYAFRDSSKLSGISFSSTLMAIGEEAFYGCDNLTGDLIFPEGLKYIGKNAFYRCNQLNGTISIPSTVKSIGEYAFDFSRNITNLVVAEGTNYTSKVNGNETNCLIEKNGENLKAILGYKNSILAEGITSIGKNAFDNCTGLASQLTIPNSVRVIGERAFAGCSQLTSVKFGNGVKSLGYMAFYYCTGLSKVTFGSGLISIGSESFYNCQNLTSLIFPESLTTIEYNALGGCVNLTNISFGSNLQKIASSNLYNFVENNQDKFDEDGVLYLTSRDGSVKYLLAASSETSGEYRIAENTQMLADGAFSGCEQLTSVIIPDSIEIIPEYAFQSCSQLNQITLPSNLRVIESYAFQYSRNFNTTFVIPESVEIIEYYAFYGTNITHIVIENADIVLEDGAFRDCQVDVVFTKSTSRLGPTGYELDYYWTSGSSFASAYYFTESDTVGEGNFWRYKADGVTIEYTSDLGATWTTLE